MYRVLSIEDEPTVQKSVEYMIKEFTNIDQAFSLEEGRAFLDKGTDYDIILLDISLPDGNGVDFFTEINNDPKVCSTFRGDVIFLTGNSEVSTLEQSFDMGAIDFIRKPFVPMEFKARVKAAVKRAAQKKEDHSSLKLGSMNLDINTSAVTLSGGSAMQPFTPKEFKILWMLAKNYGNSLKRDHIMKEVWNITVSSRTIDAHISKLRGKMTDAGLNEFTIKGVYGDGYKLVKV
jgi:DNA-binding response OmpR family regulator